VPDVHAAAHPVCVVAETLGEVVEQRLERGHVQHGETGPVLGGHAAEDWEHRRLGLAAGGGCEQECVLSVEEQADGVFLEGTESRPAEGVDDVVLEEGVEGGEPPRGGGAHHRSMSSGSSREPDDDEAAADISVSDRSAPASVGVKCSRGTKSANISTRSITSTSIRRYWRGAIPTCPPSFPATDSASVRR